MQISLYTWSNWNCFLNFFEEISIDVNTDTSVIQFSGERTFFQLHSASNIADFAKN